MGERRQTPKPDEAHEQPEGQSQGIPIADLRMAAQHLDAYLAQQEQEYAAVILLRSQLTGTVMEILDGLLPLEQRKAEFEGQIQSLDETLQRHKQTYDAEVKRLDEDLHRRRVAKDAEVAEINAQLDKARQAVGEVTGRGAA
jgi:chromosome segregation ATPase